VLGTGFKDELVDIAMECIVGEIQQFIYSLPIIVNLVTPVTVLFLVGIFEGKDSSSARV
jgi:hypothetical protein